MFKVVPARKGERERGAVVDCILMIWRVCYHNSLVVGAKDPSWCVVSIFKAEAGKPPRGTKHHPALFDVFVVVSLPPS